MESVDSTNEWAKRTIDAGNFIEGTIYQCSFQTHGKGQHARVWQSPAGQNALFTIVLKPDFLPLSHYAFLNFTVSLACRKICSQYVPGAPVQLKWPNDVLIQGLKVGGILIENIVVDNNRFTLVGIGLNVNQSHFPASLPAATSLYLQTGVRIPVDEMVSNVTSEILLGYNALKVRDNMQVIQENYIAALYMLHSDICFRYNGQVVKGKVVGVDELGRIRIYSGGQTRAFRHGEIHIEWT